MGEVGHLILFTFGECVKSYRLDLTELAGIMYIKIHKNRKKM